ncbi:MAG: disulfide bond formation protein B [Gemmataceae bacterium]
MSIEPRTPPSAGPLTLLALILSWVAVVGSVFLTLGMGLTACPLCFYQRAFACAVAATLSVGVTTGMARTTALSALTLPICIAGLSVAGFHVWLEQSGKLECPAGVAGLGSAPTQSCAIFALLTLVLLSEAWQDLRPGGGWSATLGSILLGVVLALLCIASAPRLNPAPEKPYEEAPRICRPPYVAPAE